MENRPAPTNSTSTTSPCSGASNVRVGDHRQTDSATNGDVAPFPIPLTSIERFHWFDDQDGYPNHVMARLEFDSELDAALAKAAWELALKPHPLANVYPESSRTWWGARWNWRSSVSREAPIDDWQHSRFDFARTTHRPVDWASAEHACSSPTGCYLGARVWSDKSTGESGSVLWFRIHHAVADGLACLQVINDWLVIYNHLKLGEQPDPKLRKVDPNLVHHRARLGLLKWRYLRKLPLQSIALFGAAKFLFRKTAHLLPSKITKEQSADADEPYPCYVSQWLDESSTRQLYQTAGEFSVNANSILLGLWFECLGRWRIDCADNESRKSKRKNEWLRIILPISIRSHADRRMPAANRTAIVQIDRKTPNEEELPRLFKNVDREIGIIRAWQLEKMFLIFLRLFSFSDQLLKKVATHPNSRGVSVFTDLGRPFLLASKRLNRLNQQLSDSENDNNETVLPVDFDLMGPVRAGTPLNLSVARYNDRLKLTLHFAAQSICREQADAILGRFVASLGQDLSSVCKNSGATRRSGDKDTELSNPDSV